MRIDLHHVGGCIIVLKTMLIGVLLWRLFNHPGPIDMSFDRSFFGFMLVGAIAQIIDGTLGMAYGVSCSSLLMGLGLSPAIASASVHTAEVFTTGVSGLSHLYFGNVDRKLFFQLALPGIVGAMLGAYLLSDLLDGKTVKPYISGYLLIIGFLIIYESFRSLRPIKQLKHISFLGFLGAFCDVIGGGGWGPIVTSHIIQQGHASKETIGTVNTAEFFISFFSTGVFIYFIGVNSWKIVLALIAGGVIAAPLAAMLVGKIPSLIIMRLVGITVIIVSTVNIYMSLFFPK